MENFDANSLPVLIGSLPLSDHEEAIKLVFQHTPEIPLWVQLPVYKKEGMLEQFLPGMPGLVSEKDRVLIDTDSENFDNDLLGFYEDYTAAVDGVLDFDDSRFALKADTAKGFFVFMEHLKAIRNHPVAVKGQITGPITFGTSVNDQNGRAIFYDEQIRDAAVKLLALKARWQVKKLSQFGSPVLIFFDEPALAGFGSSAFIGISRDEAAHCFEEVIEAVHSEGGRAGIHVCANADWSLVFESSADIVSFDAYSFFDRLILYPEHIKKFIESGNILAWGIVPTLRAEDIEKETTDSLVAQWENKARRVAEVGIDMKLIRSQSLITPSCGTGSLSLDHAKKVLKLTKSVSDRLRNKT